MILFYLQCVVVAGTVDDADTTNDADAVDDADSVDDDDSVENADTIPNASTDIKKDMVSVLLIVLLKSQKLSSIRWVPNIL